MSKKIILSEQDYNILSTYLVNGYGFSEFCSRELEEELKTAKIVSSSKFPGDVVRINSKVRIMELENRKEFAVQLVKPSLADSKENKISIIAPLAAALIGYKKGDTVKWKVPSGIKRFRILEVIN